MSWRQVVLVGLSLGVVGGIAVYAILSHLERDLRHEMRQPLVDTQSLPVNVREALNSGGLRIDDGY